MQYRTSRFAGMAIIGVLSALAYGQADFPIGTVTAINVRPNLSGLPDGPFGADIAFPPAGPVLLHELDRMRITVSIVDPNWGTATDNSQDVFYAVNSRFVPFPPSPSPDGPAFSDIPDVPRFLVGRPPPPGTGPVFATIDIQAPKLSGPNQARLNGTIGYDARYIIQFGLVNRDGDIVFENPTQEDPPIVPIFPVDVILNAAAQPGNPPPIADAGSDKTVQSGTTLVLDGSRSFDSSNTGFDPFDGNVIYKDILTYQWEWISGPEVVSPSVTDPTNKPQFAEVTLNTIGTYVFRLSVTDNVNPAPSTDTVTVKVVSIIPQNRLPVAKVIAPTTNVLVGSTITLDGTQSSDPDGDALSFRWVQTDELGGKLSTDLIEQKFQPLSGVNEPVATWQAIAAGTYYFRLIVNDGKASSVSSVSVNVVTTGTAGAVAENPNVANDSAANLSPILPTGACGAGFGMAALAPLAALFIRSRRR